MISLSSSNNELGLRRLEEEQVEVVMEEESGEDELEEESTHSYVSCIDPDVTLSYIDEKLENVLGHFQKDFEGGVSAENLGSKFGGYGSFLSMYQRSPAAKSPAQVGVRSNGSASSVVPEMSISGSASKGSVSDVSAKLRKFVKSSSSEQKSAPSNHKTLRLRIKVGSSDISSLKNVSLPSTSRVTEVEEYYDSPTKIIMAMVSFPLHKDQLLSPLSDDLIRLGQKEKVTNEDGSGFVDKLGSHDISIKERVKKYKQPSKRLDGNRIVSSNTENESCEELLSKTMKLPLLSCPSLSHINQTKEIDDKLSEGTLRERNDMDIDATALMSSKPEPEDKVTVVQDRSIKETESFDAIKDVNSLESKQKREKAPSTEPEKELSGTCKKPKTGKSRFSDKTTIITQPSPEKAKDSAKASSHDDRKRKLKESKEIEATVIAESGEKVRKKRKLKESENGDRDRQVARETGIDSASEISKSNVDEPKGSLAESVAPLAMKLDQREVKTRTLSESDERHETNSNAVDTVKRNRDGEGYSTIDKPGTTKKAAETSKDSNLVVTGKANDENLSVEKYKPTKPERDLGESQRKNGEEGLSRPSKDNNRATETPVQVKTKESGSKKRPMERNKQESREDNIKLETNGNHVSSFSRKPDVAKTSHGKSNNHVGVTAEKPKHKTAPQGGADQVEGSGHGNEISNTKKQVARNDRLVNQKQNGRSHEDKKESTSQAVANSMKEARDLKHIADRLQNAGCNHESTGVYFQAALKFLHGASLMELSSTEHARSRHIYGSTAKLCAFCAHEYEKSKDMGAAALAYKCMEVAYLRITNSSYSNISRYRNELQAALQVTPSGESPSFASDGENSNLADKVGLSNTVKSSPRVTGNHVISSGNNSSLAQLLAFSENVSFAMDASRKAQMALAAAAKVKPVDDTRYSSEGITCIKRAIDFNFQDMEKLLHVVKVAMESINR